MCFVLEMSQARILVQYDGDWEQYLINEAIKNYYYDNPVNEGNKVLIGKGLTSPAVWFTQMRERLAVSKSHEGICVTDEDKLKITVCSERYHEALRTKIGVKSAEKALEAALSSAYRNLYQQIAQADRAAWELGLQKGMSEGQEMEESRRHR